MALVIWSALLPGICMAALAAPWVQPQLYSERFSVAPMMEYTDEHFRTLLRMLTRRATLYTEMVCSTSLEYNSGPDLDRWLDFGGRADGKGHVVLQLGGQDDSSLSLAVERSAPWRYDAINLNCGCPSLKVAGKGNFGAALMQNEHQVARLCAVMQSVAGEVPITVKCRIGVVDTEADLDATGALDDEETFLALCRFVRTVSKDGGVRRFIVHARKAVLNGLGPRANRRVPPLRHDLVIRLGLEFPELSFVLNGGVQDVTEALRPGGPCHLPQASAP